jgi:hypothetical protein
LESQIASQVLNFTRQLLRAVTLALQISEHSISPQEKNFQMGTERSRK